MSPQVPILSVSLICADEEVGELHTQPSPGFEPKPVDSWLDMLTPTSGYVDQV